MPDEKRSIILQYSSVEDFWASLLSESPALKKLSEIEQEAYRQVFFAGAVSMMSLLFDNAVGAGDLMLRFEAAREEIRQVSGEHADARTT